MRRAAGVLLGLGAALLAASCGEEIAVRQGTRVHPDGTIGRTVLIAAREPGRKEPTPAAWIDSLVDLARPDAWGRVDRTATSIRAEGVFASAAEIPPTLRHQQGDDAWVTDRQAVMLSVEDLRLLRVFTYEEIWGDPFGPEKLEDLVDTLSALVTGRLRDNITRHFGGEIDPGPAVAQIRRRGEALFRDVAASLRATQFDPDEVQKANLAAVFRTHGLPPLPAGALESAARFLQPVLDWSRDLCAQALSTPDRRIEAADLGFWPTPEEVERRFESGEEETPDPELAALGDALVSAVFGVYGSGDHHFQVQVTVRLPGRLVSTDGMPDGDDGAIWVLGHPDLNLGRNARAVSVELDRQVLVDLGARREYGPAALLELVTVLRDLPPVLDEALDEAIRKRSLAPLRQAGRRDLLELLDPSLPPWPEP